MRQADEVIVFDDDSEDGTGKVAADLGATLISYHGGPPSGWRGKNWACHNLLEYAKKTDVDWFVLIDADAQVTGDISAALSRADKEATLVTGIPTLQEGAGWEPLLGAWSPWLILSSCPFWLVELSGHRRPHFANGQFMAWRSSSLDDFDPYVEVKHQVLEDVGIGRLLAKKRRKTSVLNLTKILKVRMYETGSDAWKGYLKNSVHVLGPGPSTYAVGLLFFALAVLAVSSIWLYLISVGAMLAAMLTVKRTVWPALFAPLVLAIAGLSFITSDIKWRRGDLEWKGRNVSQ